MSSSSANRSLSTAFRTALAAMGLADRGGLKEGVLVDPRAGLHVGDSVGFGPVDLEVLDGGDPHARDALPSHQFLQGVGIVTLTVGILGSLYPLDDFGRGQTV